MYTEVTIELLSDPSVTITESSMQLASNVSNNSGPLTTYGTNNAFKGFFLMSSADNKPVATLDGSFECFDTQGYSGAVGKSNVAYFVEYRLRFGSTPNVGCTLVLDPTGAPQVNKVSVVSFNTSGTIVSNKTVEVDPTYPLIILMPEMFTTTYVAIRLYTVTSNLNNYVKILYAFPNITTMYRGTDLIKYECSENMLDAQLTFTPGICEQYINATVYDRNNVLQQLAAQEKLTTGRIINVYAVDDAFRERIGQYYSEDWDIQNCESDVGITGGDGFKYLSNFDFRSAGVQERSVAKMLSDAFGYAGVQWKYQDDDTQLYCQYIWTRNCWYPDTDIISLLEDICKVAMLRIYYYNGVFIVGRAITWQALN